MVCAALADGGWLGRLRETTLAGAPPSPSLWMVSCRFVVNRLFVYMYGWEVERAWPALRSREHYTSSCTFYNIAFIYCVITSTCLCRLPVDLVPHQPSAGDPFFAAVKDTTTTKRKPDLHD